MENEMQEKLNFLDVTICKQNNKIITSWFRKSSNTLNFNSWNSFGPKAQIINTVKAMKKNESDLFGRTDFNERYGRTENELYQK